MTVILSVRYTKNDAGFTLAHQVVGSGSRAWPPSPGDLSVHLGEIERAGKDVRGIAVRASARDGDRGPIRGARELDRGDLTAGSGIVFEDAGEHESMGVPDR